MTLSFWLWTLLILLFWGCFQIHIFKVMFRQYQKELASHIEAVAVLIAALQPTSIREHSRRVATISEKLAMEMKISSKRMPIIRAAGLLHEVSEIKSIPGQRQIEADILAVADYFDSAIFNLDEPKSTDSVIEEMRREAGTKYEPAVVKALMKLVLQAES